MKEIVVLSGKGGAGKTSLAASLFASTPRAVAVDADVDAADLELLLGGSRAVSEVWMGRRTARVDPQGCTGCGRCVPACAFGALSIGKERRVVVDESACEGCGVCAVTCRRGAISLEPLAAAVWHRNSTRWGRLFHARLSPGEENSGRLVAFLRRQARDAVLHLGGEWIWTDGPPGIGCAAISSLSGADRALVVVAPGESGHHDARRVLELAAKMRVPADVVGNRTAPGEEGRVEALAREFGARSLGCLPRDPAFVEAEFAGLPVVAMSGTEMVRDLAELAENVRRAA